MKTLAKTSKLQKRQAPQNENQQQEPPTKEEVAKSFERDLPQEKKKENEASKRPFSNSSNSPPIQSQKRKQTTTEKIRSLFDLDVEISTDSSTEFDKIRSYANPCRYELIQKSTGHYFACACEKQYLNVNAAGKLSVRRKGFTNANNARTL